MKNIRLLSGLPACVFLTAGIALAENYLITTIAGGGNILGDGGNALSAGLSKPRGVAVDVKGNDLIRKLILEESK